VHVGGSDLLQTAVGEPLTRYVQATHLDVLVDLQGSVPALTALKEGKIQLAILTAPLGQTPWTKDFKAIPLCFSVDYIIVNQANPLNALTLRQIASVFGESKQGPTTWGDLQASAEWAARPVVPCATSTDDGLVLEMFKNEILGGNALRPTVHVLASAREMLKTVADNPNAIGLGGYDPGPPNKVLQISSADAAVAAARVLATGSAKGAARPTPENVSSGEYPLRLPFYLVYNPADQARILPLLRLLLSDEYAARLQAEHYVPVPDTERNRARLELDNPK
jgi:phosphate transport system substrate-binding protein